MKSRTPSNAPGVAHEDRLIAVCRVDGGNVAIAPCFFHVVPSTSADDLVEIQVTPAGAFRPRDGRKMPVDAWNLDAASAAQVIARFRANKTPLVVDYEHQTLQAETNGQPAPAAGFIRDLEWREGYGLVAKVELTQRARDYIAGGEYRYFSPVFLFDKHTGTVTQLLMGALTNNPALDGMAQIARRAAARYELNEEADMLNKHLLAIAVCMAISVEGIKDDDALQSAITDTFKAQGTGDLVALRTQLGLKDDAGAEEIGTAVVALKAQATAATAATAGAKPDPAKYVEVGVVEDMRTQIATLTAENTKRTVEDLVNPALEDGRLLPAQASWARELGAKDVAALKTYLSTAQPIAALAGTQTDGQPPVGTKDANGLTPAELAVCSATGTDPKAFAAAKAA